MNHAQPGILAPVPHLARYQSFVQKHDGDPKAALAELQTCFDGETIVVGLGHSLVAVLGGKIPGLRTFPADAVNGIDIPSTPAALWCWVRGTDRGEILHEARRTKRALSQAFELAESINAFQYRDSRDLTGYEDGTENPEGDEAIKAGIFQQGGEGLSGSSFVAVQRWIHDLDRFESMPTQARDHTIGRRISDNEEIDDAPESAHVKRSAQEDFEPEAFMLRRSMPWADATREGLVFVAFGKSFDAFEAVQNRMLGKDDGTTDALYTFTRPVTGSYFWCPPVADGRLDLRALDL